jgi:hypothetical protein
MGIDKTKTSVITKIKKYDTYWKVSLENGDGGRVYIVDYELNLKVGERVWYTMREFTEKPSKYITNVYRVLKLHTNPEIFEISRNIHRLESVIDYLKNQLNTMK